MITTGRGRGRGRGRKGRGVRLEKKRVLFGFLYLCYFIFGSVLYKCVGEIYEKDIRAVNVFICDINGITTGG